MWKVNEKAPGAVTKKLINQWKKDFDAVPVRRAAMNALTKTSIENVAMDREVYNDFDFVFSEEIEIKGPPTDQERAGTCWLFADVNFLRFLAAKKLNYKEFTFSHNHHEFFDKLEKANYFLEKVIEYRKRDLLDRHLVHIMQNPVSDGGDWLYTLNCIAKYGLVPLQVMPDTFNLKNSRFMNDRLAYKCRQGAMIIREMEKQGKTLAQIRKAKEEIMSEIYSLLVMFLGKPPEKFSWAYYDDGPKDEKKKGGKKKAAKKKKDDKKKKFHRFENITPQEFVKKCMDFNADDYVTLLNLPAEGYKMNQPYVVELGQNTVGAPDVLLLNVDMKELKNATLKSIKDGMPVLYASDAGPGRDPWQGFYHRELYDYESLFDMKFPMDKKAAITYFQTS